MRHASEAFNDDEHPLEDFGAEAFWQDNEVEEEESVKAEEAEELREIRENEECPDIHVDRENAPGPNGGAAEEDEEEPPDERQCRICFSGQEEEDTLGRLISPCLCAGSMRVSFGLEMLLDDQWVIADGIVCSWYVTYVTAYRSIS